MPGVALAGTAALAFSDGRAVAIGAPGDALPHNTMALVNVAYNISYGWTKPQLGSLEAQMREPRRRGCTRQARSLCDH
jgi:hypothetical protein